MNPSPTLALPPQLAALLGSGKPLPSSIANMCDIYITTQHLYSHVQHGTQSNSEELSALCIRLARGLDHAFTYGQRPPIANLLPMLMKQLCRREHDEKSQGSIMVLMLSVKNTCKIGWYPKKESEELLAIADQIGEIYKTMENVNDGPSSCHSTISKIMYRFYPKMDLGPILASIEAKPGYGASAVDFHITKSSFVPDKRICLLVARTDNIETSACLINPEEVTFILNGTWVFEATCVPMEIGPQMPTNVRNLLRFGTNLLQAVGQFNGHYLIVVAYLSDKSLPKHILQDYVQPAVTSVDSDSDLIEDGSRISLNCPISLTRIKTPVKGHSCKHFQCFDFDNFININSKKPSWRCPCCNQYVCYADIRLDRNMVEILKNVGENIVEVTVLADADGSWKAVLENDDHVDKIKDKAPNCEKEQAELKESICSRSTVANVLDLTSYDDDLDMMETEDRKPFPESVASQFVTPSLTYSGMNSTAVHENVAAHIEDGFGSGVYVARAQVGVSEHPVLPDTVSSASNQEAEGHGIIQAINSAVHNQFTSPNNFQLQLNVNSVANEYGRLSSMPRPTSRIPVTTQALPVQSQVSRPQQNSVTNLNSLLLSGSSAPHVSSTNPASVDAFNIIMSGMDIRQLYNQSQLSMPPVSGVNSYALQNHSTIQNRGPSVVNMSAQTQSQNPPSVSGFLSELRNPHLQQALNPRPLQPMQSWPWMQQGGSQTGVPQAAAATANSQQARVMASGRQGSSQAGVVHTAGTNSNLQQARFMAAAQASRQSQSFTSQYQTPAAAVQSVSRPEDLFSSQPDQNWRPSRRMRGSIELGSHQYSEAVRQQIIMPTQPVQNSRSQGPQPVPVQSSRPHGPLPVPVQSSRPQVHPPHWPTSKQ